MIELDTIYMHYVGFELNSEYMKIIKEKTKVETDLFAR